MKYAVTVEGKEPREIEVWEAEEGLFARLGDQTHQVDTVSIDGGNFYSLLLDQQSHEVFLEEREGSYAVVIHGRLYEVLVEGEQARRAQALRPAQVTGVRTIVTAPMPGLVVSLAVAEGQIVTEGQRLAVLEAMKMENEIRAPRAGTVQRVDVAVGDSVMQGQALLTLS
jgi:biotin carboxyl carrier protein